MFSSNPFGSFSGSRGGHGTVTERHVSVSVAESRRSRAGTARLEKRFSVIDLDGASAAAADSLAAGVGAVRVSHGYDHDQNHE